MTHSPYPSYILYVHYQTDISDGSTVQVARFIEHFGALCQQRNVRFDVLAPPPRPSSTNCAESYWRRFRASLGRYYLRDFKVAWKQWRRSLIEEKQLRANRPDLVITVYDAETISLLWACQRLSIPVVPVFNGMDRFELKQTYMQLKQLPWFDRLFSNSRVLELSAGAMTVTETIAAPLRANNPENKPVRVNHNGVDLSRFSLDTGREEIRATFGWKDTTLVLGYVGSFILWHKPERMIEAFAKLWEQNLDVALLLVGRKLPELESRIAELPAEAQKRVIWPGLVAHNEVPRYLAAIDLALLPYTMPYCSPMKLIEYMAMAKASVAPDTAGVREIMTPEVEGVVFPPESSAAFYSAVQRLSMDAGLRNRLGQAARARIEREFTWDCHAERTWSLVTESWSWWQQQNNPQQIR